MNQEEQVQHRFSKTWAGIVWVVFGALLLTACGDDGIDSTEINWVPAGEFGALADSALQGYGVVKLNANELDGLSTAERKFVQQAYASNIPVVLFGADQAGIDALLSIVGEHSHEVRPGGDVTGALEVFAIDREEKMQARLEIHPLSPGNEADGVAKLLTWLAQDGVRAPSDADSTAIASLAAAVNADPDSYPDLDKFVQRPSQVTLFVESQPAKGHYYDLTYTYLTLYDVVDKKYYTMVTTQNYADFDAAPVDDAIRDTIYADAKSDADSKNDDAEIICENPLLFTPCPRYVPDRSTVVGADPPTASATGVFSGTLTAEYGLSAANDTTPLVLIGGGGAGAKATPADLLVEQHSPDTTAGQSSTTSSVKQQIDVGVTAKGPSLGYKYTMTNSQTTDLLNVDITYKVHNNREKVEWHFQINNGKLAYFEKEYQTTWIWSFSGEEGAEVKAGFALHAKSSTKYSITVPTNYAVNNWTTSNPWGDYTFTEVVDSVDTIYVTLNLGTLPAQLIDTGAAK